jgi:triacylglycerol lipase
MSIFVEIPQEAYPADAITPFKPMLEFKLENARAMVWLSQLAYETAHPRKVSDIIESWTLKMREFISNDPGTGLPPHSACVIVAEGREAMFVTFAGSDPGKPIDWVTDFQAMPSPTDLHSGFDAAVATVWPKIQAAIANRLMPKEPVFFTGHSLGGALAILAAARAAQLPNPPEIVVYTFGSPRNGGTNSPATIRLAIPPTAWFTAPISCRPYRRRCSTAITTSDARYNAQAADSLIPLQSCRATVTSRI